MRRMSLILKNLCFLYFHERGCGGKLWCTFKQEVVEETAVCFCFVFNAKRPTKERDADDVGGGSLWAQDVCPVHCRSRMVLRTEEN